MTFILTMNPINKATFAAQQYIGSQKNQLQTEEAKKKEEAQETEAKEEDTTQSKDNNSKPKAQPPSLTTAQIAAQKNKAIGSLVNLTAKNEFDRTFELSQRIIQEAIKLQLPQGQDIQKATKSALNEGLTTFAAAEVYKLFDEKQKTEKNKQSQLSFKDKFKKNPEYSEDIFDTAKFIVSTIKQYGNFDLEKIDLNGPDSREARKAFENLNDPHKLMLVTTVLQEATDHFMAETSAKLNDPLQSVQATAENSLALAKAVMAAENKARQYQYTLNKYQNYGINPLGIA